MRLARPRCAGGWEVAAPISAANARTLVAAAIIVTVATILAAPLAAQAMEIRSFTRTAEGGRLTADFVVAAPPDKVFDVVVNDQHFSEFMPYIVSSETLERHGFGSRSRIRAKRFGLFDFVLVYDRRYTADRRRVTWREIGGYFKRDDGVWTVAPHPRGTLVGYEILIDPGFFVPDFLLKFAIEQGLPEIGRAVRLRAESGGTWKKART